MNNYQNYPNPSNYNKKNIQPYQDTFVNMPESAYQNNVNTPGPYPHYINDVNYGHNTNLYDPYQGFIRGNMFQNMYDPYDNQKPYEIRPMNEQAELLTDYDALCFATIDLNLYLDVNPDDRNAIELFNKYNMQKKQVKEAYESKYGPLSLDSEALNTCPWAWDNKPWPWEN